MVSRMPRLRRNLFHVRDTATGRTLPGLVRVDPYAAVRAAAFNAGRHPGGLEVVTPNGRTVARVEPRV